MMDSCKSNVADMPACVEKAASLTDEDRLAEGAAADKAQSIETNITIKDALLYYWKAVLWSLAMSMATIMESYDLLLISSFFASPQFNQRFGEQLPSGTWSIPAPWQIGLTMVTNVGMIVGGLSNGYFADRFGPRIVMLVNHIALASFVFIQFFAVNIEMLMVGTLLVSVPCGFFAAATPSYASEIAPLKLRGYLVVYVNLCWVMGKLIAFGVITSMLGNPTQWSYRIPFALQWMWFPFMAAATWLAPESPWWLVKQGRVEDAGKVLERLCTAPRDVINPQDSLAMITRTIRLERMMDIQGSYFDCFKGENLRRTEISMVCWGCQILPGFAIQNYITYFFTLAGLSPDDSFKMSLGNAGLAFVGTVLSWFMMTKFGWRSLYLYGLVAMLPVMGLVGFLDLAVASNPNIRWAQAALLLVWFFIYGISIGPIPYTVAASVGAAWLRVKTISLGRITYYFLSIINVIVSPYLLNADEANLQGKTAFVATGLTFFLAIWTFFRLPELKGMTAETLDQLFHEKTNARKFVEASKQYQ